jgi:hypothetical protein
VDVPQFDLDDDGLLLPEHHGSVQETAPGSPVRVAPPYTC